MDAIEVMKNTKTFAILGASAREDSYGYELVKILSDLNYRVFPINPKYDEIYNLKCFKSYKDIDERVDNLVFAMSPQNSIKVLSFIENIDCYVWFPPECWDDEVIEIAKSKQLKYLKDVCPIGTYLKMSAEQK